MDPCHVFVQVCVHGQTGILLRKRPPSPPLLPTPRLPRGRKGLQVERTVRGVHVYTPRSTTAYARRLWSGNRAPCRPQTPAGGEGGERAVRGGTDDPVVLG